MNDCEELQRLRRDSVDRLLVVDPTLAFLVVAAAAIVGFILGCAVMAQVF